MRFDLFKVALALLAGFALMVLVLVPRLELHAEREAHATTKREHAEERVQLLAAVREQEIAMQRAVARAQGDLDEARRTIRRRDEVIGRLRTDGRGLREQLAAYATADARDSACASDDRPGILAGLAAEGAELLARGGALLRACAADHDERAAEVTALLAAWPRPAVPSVAD